MTTTTQQEHPLRAAVRTFLQSWLPQIVSAVVIIPLVIQAIVDEAAKHGIVLPSWLSLALIGIVTACAFVSAIIARIMAIPGVDKFLERFRLGSAPASTLKR